MIVYQVYCDSLHKIRYVFGTFAKREVAEKMLTESQQQLGSGASGPHFGIMEIEVTL